MAQPDAASVKPHRASETPGTVIRASGSLSRQLLWWIVLPQLILWLVGAFVTYNVAFTYANQVVDRSLFQTSRALARQVKPIGNGLLIDFPKAARDIIETDPDDTVYYMVSTPPGRFILGNRQLPPPPPKAGLVFDSPYFYDARIDTIKVRVAALMLPYGEQGAERMLVQVAKSRASRELLARRILIDTALPLSGLIVLMTLIVWGGIRAGLAPLSRLRRLVEDRHANDLTPIQMASAPNEVRALALALNSLLGAVQRNVDTQKRFISDAAHQLRTPLAGMKSQAELALSASQDPTVRARLERVRESAIRSAHVVNQLLTLARAEPESAMKQGQVRVALGPLTRELTAELVPRALQLGVDLGCDDSEADAEALDQAAEAVAVTGNPLLLREALVNLVDNAMRYAGKGSEVTVRARLEGDRAIVEVEDNGPGIPTAEHDRVFERFVRGVNDGSGCGLGLAIVKEIVQQHGGQVALFNVFPRGLRVRVSLPAAHSHVVTSTT
jgi:two-component system sensor histidine kinase TctE